MKRSIGIILALLLLAFCLRVWNLSAQSIWWDEAFTWQTASHGLANFWQMLLAGDRNPPLYFVSVALWGSAAGWSEFSLRFVSVAWTMVGLAFLFNFVRRLYNTSAGMWSLALGAVAPALVVYAQEARMYAAFFALTVVTLYFGMRIAEFGPDPSRPAIHVSDFVAFLGCEAALLLTHYFALPLVITINLCALVILALRRARFVIYAKWIAGQILAMLPIVIWALLVFTTPGSLITAKEPAPDLVTFAYQIGILWLTGIRDLGSAQAQLVLPALGLILIASVGAWLENSRSTSLALAFGIISLVFAFALTSMLTSFHPRYLLPYSVFLLALVGGALSHLRFNRAQQPVRFQRAALLGEWVAGGLTLLMALFLIVSGWLSITSPAFAKDDTRSLAAYLKQHAAADDVILLEANDYTLNYYDHGPAQAKMITATTELEAFQQLSSAIGDARKVWLPHWNVSTQDARGYWPFLLELAGSLRSHTSFQGYELTEYAMQSPLHEGEMKSASPGDMITQRSNLAGQGVDGALAFALTWQTPVKFFEPARVSVRLIDLQGDTLSTRDAALLDEHGRTTDRWDTIDPVKNFYVLPIAPGTPPGSYTITAQLYNTRSVLANEVVGKIDLTRRLDTSDPYHTLSGYDWRVPANPQIAPGLVLEAYALGSPNPQQPLDVTLRWRKTGSVSGATPRLRLVQAGQVWSEMGSDLLEHVYPIEQWANGETVIDRLKITYPPVRGPIDLQIGQGDRWSTLSALRLDESRLQFSVPSMQHTQTAQFGDFAEMLGYDLKSDSLSSARPLNLSLYWRSANTEPITMPYTVFTQILAPDGHLVAQHDAPPNPPTTQWVPGQIVIDNHALKVVDPAYRGPATLIVGWYNSATVERIPADFGGDYVVLTTPVQVQNP